MSDTQKDLDVIEAEIAKAKQGLAQRSEAELQKIKEQLKAELREEQEAQRKAEEEKRAKEEAEKKAEEEKLQKDKELEELKKKVDELAASKQVVSGENPFKGKSEEGHPVDQMSDEKIENVEERAAEAFFGESWRQVKNNL